MINLDDTIRRMISNVEAIRALLHNISTEQAQWKPDPETWSMKEVMEHVYNEERFDFRLHLKEMFNDPPQPWGAFRQDWIKVESFRQALDGFVSERDASIAWLRELESPDWEIQTRVSFGPQSETFNLKAGDVLVSWVEHDFLHLRQMNELLHAWNVHRASPYSVQYAGGW